jgi:protein phosphatase
LQVIGLTHPGRERSRNEDSFLIKQSPRLHLLAVADGLGGHQAGDVASNLAVEILEQHWGEMEQELTGAPKSQLAEFVQNLMYKANHALLEQSSADSTKQGMGTTLTMGLVADGHLTIGHVGDSRAYLVNGEQIRLLTEDHSLLGEMIQAGDISPDEAQGHPQRHILTRALGSSPEIKIDLIQQELEEGFGLIFCTDGLTSLVREEEILSLYLKHDDLNRLAKALIDLANKRGGFDNITVVLARDSRRQK